MRNVSKIIATQVFLRYFSRDLNANGESLLFLIDGKQWRESRDYRLYTDTRNCSQDIKSAKTCTSLSFSLVRLFFLSRCATINIDRISSNRFDTDE